MTRKVYASLDVAKFIMALMILLGHTANEWAHTTGIWHYILSCDFTVPTFFAISGFLFFSKILQMKEYEERKDYYRKWSVRIGKMYLIWTIIYFLFILTNWISKGVEFRDILFWIIKSIAFTSYPTIWFLPSLWVGVSICWLLVENVKKIKSVYAIVAILWLIGVLMDPYRFLVLNSPNIQLFYDGYMQVFGTFRNGFFYGSAYVLVGYCVAKKASIPSISKSLIGIVVFQLLFVTEAFFMKKLNSSSCTDMAIMMLPSVYFILLFLLNIDIKGNSLTLLFRKYSMLVFLGQRLFLTAIPSVIPISYSEYIRALPQIEIYLIFTLLTLVFAIIIELLSRKIRFLNYLM